MIKAKHMVLVYIKNDLDKLVIGRFLHVTGYPFQIVDSEEDTNSILRKEKVEILVVELESLETNHLDFSRKARMQNECLEPVIYAIHPTELTYREVEVLGYDFLLASPLKLSGLKSISNTSFLLKKFKKLETRIAELCEGDEDFQKDLTAKLVLQCKKIKEELKNAMEETNIKLMKNLKHGSTTLLSILGVKELDDLFSEGLDYLQNSHALVPDQFYHDLDFTINSIVNNLSKKNEN